MGRLPRGLSSRDAYDARMRVYLCRHAEAAPGDPDELRELSAAGREQARGLASRLAALPEPPAVVLTSPLLRARQTAEEIATATGARVLVEPRLAPGATAELLREALDASMGAVATVGHQPDCTAIAVAISGKDPGFPPGGVAELRLRP